MTRTNSLTIALVVLAAYTVFGQTVSVFESDRFRAELNESVVIDDVNRLYSHTLDVVAKASGQRDRIRWIDHAVRFEDVSPLGRRVVLFGTIGSAPTVAVLDVDLKQETGLIVCRDPRLSTDGRFLAFRQFVPRTVVGETSDLVLLIDLAQTPKRNRESGVPSDWLLDAQSYGQVIYPPGVAGHAYTFAEFFGPGSKATIDTGFQWAHRSRTLVFISREDAQYRLVAISVGEDGKTNVPRQRRLDAKDFIEANASPEVVRQAMAKCVVTGLEIESDDKAVVSIKPDSIFSRDRVVMALP